MHDKDPTTLCKYTRQHLLEIFDALHDRQGFENQTIEMYPEREIPRSIQYKRPQKVNINEDSDISPSDLDDGQPLPDHSTVRSGSPTENDTLSSTPNTDNDFDLDEELQ